MKKILAIILAAVMVLALAACGTDEAEPATNEPVESNQPVETTPAPVVEPTQTEQVTPVEVGEDLPSDLG